MHTATAKADPQMAAWLHGARRALGMTQRQLGEALGLHGDPARSIRKFERGETAVSGPVRVTVRLMLERAGLRVEVSPSGIVGGRIINRLFIETPPERDSA